MQPGNLFFVRASINIATDPWWFVDNRALTDDVMRWLDRGTPFILLEHIRIGAEDIWRILTPGGVFWARQDVIDVKYRPRDWYNETR